MKRIMLKADLHVHSKYSTRPSEWILRKIGCAESYTEPKALYAIARDRGMDLVTITDHNTLAGSLEIAHLDNTFVSEEITTYFPEDRCKLHVLAYGVTEAQHEDITRFRENVFDLVVYLNKEGIVHALAHPLYAINDRLTAEHIEQALVLFNNLELNGSRDEVQNRVLTDILDTLKQEDIEFMAEKYGLEPHGERPWKKNLVGGSDDHSSINIATNYTEMPGASSVEDFLHGIGKHRARVNGLTSTPKTLAHNICSIAYQFYSKKFDLSRYVSKDLLLRFVDRSLMPSIDDTEERFRDRLRNALVYRRPYSFFKSPSPNIKAILQKEAKEIIFSDSPMKDLLKRSKHQPGDMEEAWFRFVNQMSEKVLKQFADTLLENVSGANLFDIFHTIGSAGSFYTMMAPYFVSYSVFTKDRRFCRRCLERLNGKSTVVEGIRVAHFTDTFYDVNGVALTLRKQIEMARKNKKRQVIITCGLENNTPMVTNFKPIGTFEMPEYPDLKLYYPPLLRMLNYCYEEDFTHIHSATPGPIGLSALAIAKILKLPLYGTYHTALPQYVGHLTNDFFMEEFMWTYMVWYYNQMDAIYVPSRATGEELASKGIPKRKIRFYPRGIDVERFHPSKKNGFFKNRYAVEDPLVKLLYVGRVSKEKNLPDLVEVITKLHEAGRRFHLVVVGSGPYLNEMQRELEGMPVTFTGFLEGEDLAQAYASSDIFIFPSATDTFGNVVLEAQASGVPVVVSDQGGPQENLIHGETGYIVRAGDPSAFVAAVTRLIDDPAHLREMKKKAREYMEDRSFEDAYIRLWESYRHVS